MRLRTCSSCCLVAAASSLMLSSSVDVAIMLALYMHHHPRCCCRLPCSFCMRIAMKTDTYLDVEIACQCIHIHMKENTGGSHVSRK